MFGPQRQSPGRLHDGLPRIKVDIGGDFLEKDDVWTVGFLEDTI